MDISYLKFNCFKILIDIGANNGEYVFFLKNAFSINRVTAFESHPNLLNHFNSQRLRSFFFSTLL